MLHIYKYVHTHTHIHKTVVTQSCPTLWDPMDCRPPGSSVHGILQARILEWLAISFSRGSSRPRDQTWVFHITGRCFTSEPPGKLNIHIQRNTIQPLKGWNLAICNNMYGSGDYYAKFSKSDKDKYLII